MPITRTVKSAKPAGQVTVAAPAADMGVVLMDQSLQPIAIDSGAATILRAVLGGHGRPREGQRRAWDLPPDVVELIRNADPANLSSVILRFSAADRLYTGRAYHVDARSAASPRPAFLLHLQREAAISTSLSRVSEEYRLTAREREALSGIATGLTSKELAERMNIRPSTVKAFLRVMMIKMGVDNRAGVVAKLLTTSAPAQEPSPPARPERASAAHAG